MASDRGDTPIEGIDLDDGTWVDAGPDGRWQPASGERVRAAVVLAVLFVALGSLALLASLGGDDDEVMAATTTTSTTEATTTTTTEPPDPSSIGGEPASARCSDDNRQALPLRARRDTTVLVLNGTTVNGHAAANTTDLEHAGYDTVVPDNADKQPDTTFHYRLGFCAEAERLAVDHGYPDAEVSPIPRNLPLVVGRAELVMILGHDSR